MTSFAEAVKGVKLGGDFAHEMRGILDKHYPDGAMSEHVFQIGVMLQEKVSPSVWVSWMANADIVLSDASVTVYHGTKFRSTYAAGKLHHILNQHFKRPVYWEVESSKQKGLL